MFITACVSNRDQLVVARKEVEELKKLLAAKEAQASGLTLVVAQHEASIVQVRSKFSRQITRIEKKETAVKESRNDWEGELATFKKHKEKHEMEVAAHSEYLLSKERIITRAQREISSIDKIEGLIMQEVFLVDVDVSVDSPLLIDLEASVVASQVAVDEANQVLLTAQSAVDRIQDEISSIDIKLPMLEAEKREAALKRDFKAAGRASKEIKDLTARREECENVLSGESKDHLEQARKDLEKVTSELCAKKDTVETRRIEIGRSRMIDLATRIRKLKKVKEAAVDGTDKNDESDGVCIISSMACALIDSQVSSLMTHGEQLGATYGCWDDILNTSIVDAMKESPAEEYVDVPGSSAIPDAKSNEEADVNDVPIEIMETKHQCTGTAENILSDIILATNYTGIDKDSAISRYKEISMTLKIMEHEVEKAVAEENFEEAAELEDAIQGLRTEIESLGLSEADIEKADNNQVVDIEESSVFSSPSLEVEQIVRTVEGDIDGYVVVGTSSL